MILLSNVVLRKCYWLESPFLTNFPGLLRYKGPLLVILRTVIAYGVK